jgi:hypothetical protein
VEVWLASWALTRQRTLAMGTIQRFSMWHSGWLSRRAEMAGGRAQGLDNS